jgi:hypothetical protein
MNAISEIAPPVARVRKRRSIADMCRRLKAVEAEIGAILDAQADAVETMDFWNPDPAYVRLHAERDALLLDLVRSDPRTEDVASMASTVMLLIDTESDPSNWSICEPLVVGLVVRVMASVVTAQCDANRAVMARSRKSERINLKPSPL